MILRTYEAGDEAAQAEVYNAAARSLPKFKPATSAEVARRCLAADFDPATRLYAEENGQIVGYVTFHANGRVSYPWCLPGHETVREPLFERVLKTMSERGFRSAFAAYRADWAVPLAYLRRQGFQVVREMVNFVLPLTDMPTRAPQKNAATPLQREDVAAVHALAAGATRAASPEDLERYLFENPYFPSSQCFVLRNPAGGPICAAGVLVIKEGYADPTQVDAAMPCFRLGAFGTEGMQVKRINGLFSYVTRDDGAATQNAVRLLEHAAQKLEEGDSYTLAAQVPSDAVHLHRFYRQQFQRQGAFPVLEKPLS